MKTMKTTLLLLVLLDTCRTPTLARGSVTVAPGRSQFFEYEMVSVSCDGLGSGEWTVWRYTTQGLEVSQCGSGWGTPTPSGCEMKTVKLPYSGVYWCSSTQGDSSNGVNITITDEPVVLHSPVLPVVDGDNVTLSCRLKATPHPPADFYRDDTLIGTGPKGHMTIRHVSKSEEGAYRCTISGRGGSLPSWLLIQDDAGPASLTPTPDSSQLFEYKSLSLSCGDNSSLLGWRVSRLMASEDKMSSCGEGWGSPTVSGCVLHTVKYPDTAVYWCETPARQRSNSVKISVHEGPVILQSPVLPVMDGDNVTLSCGTRTTFNLSADFYKDGSLIRTQPAGHVTLYHVSKFDEGLYKCNISGHGESLSSWLFVRGTPAEPLSSLSVVGTLCHIAACSPYVISTVLMVSLYRHRPIGRNSPISMTTSPQSEEDEGLDSQYDDVVAAVTTEHHF